MNCSVEVRQCLLGEEEEQGQEAGAPAMAGVPAGSQSLSQTPKITTCKDVKCLLAQSQSFTQ